MARNSNGIIGSAMRNRNIVLLIASLLMIMGWWP